MRSRNGPTYWMTNGVGVELRRRTLNGRPSGWWVLVDGARIGHVAEEARGTWRHLPRRFVTPDPTFATRREAADALVAYDRARG